MFGRLGSLVFRLRFVVLAAWVVAAVAAALLAPKLASVGSADQASFLPGSAESIQAQAVLDRAFPSQAAAGTATLAFWRDGGLTDADHGSIDAAARWLVSSDAPADVRDRVTGVIGAAGHPEMASMLRSSDGQLELVQVQLSAASFQPEAGAAVTAIRDHLRTALPDGLHGSVTGSVGIGADYISAIATATDRTTIVTVVLVVLVLLLIYRAPLAALVPLLTIGAAYVVATGLLATMAQAGWHISSLLGTFVVVLVFGVGTDYTIFLISRFREEVAGTSWDAAVTRTVSRIGAVITASAATVVIGLGSMVAGEFKMFQTTGPALAIAIIVTLVAGLTLTPALLAVLGHYLFWPRHEQGAGTADRGLFASLAGLISRRPGLLTIVVLAAMAVPAIGASGMRQSFDVLSDLPGDSDAKAGFTAVTAHFDAGRLMPITIAIDGRGGTDLTTPEALAQLRSVAAQVQGVVGVTRVESLVTPSGDGTVPDAFRPSVQLATMADSIAVPVDPAKGLEKLLDPKTTTGLQSASAYVEALAPAFPDLLPTAMAATRADLVRMPAAIGELKAAASGVSTNPARAALQQEIVTISARLPGELRALSTALADRSDDFFLPTTLTGDAGKSVAGALAAYVSDDRSVTRIYATTAADPYSSAAFDTVARVRSTLGGDMADDGAGWQILVGGQTAAQADLKATISGDFLRVAGLTVLGVFLVLMLLLRSVVAPVYLVGTVLLSYLCTLGLTSTVFQDVLGQEGLNDFLPLMVFVLLVAIGSDYNIFLMSRVREESDRRGTTAGIRAASARTGAVITSAGVILAGTFLAMVASPLTVLFQAGVMVAVGVLIDTFIVRSLLVPAITTILGERAWWPSGRRSTP